jgi:CHAD domain-containing protein
MKMEDYQKIKALTQRINFMIKELSKIQDQVLDLRDESIVSKDDAKCIIHKLNDSQMTAHTARNHVFSLQMMGIEDEIIRLKQ